jgi:hypothetical protein
VEFSWDAALGVLELGWGTFNTIEPLFFAPEPLELVEDRFFLTALIVLSNCYLLLSFLDVACMPVHVLHRRGNATAGAGERFMYAVVHPNMS